MCVGAQMMWAADNKNVKMMESLVELGANVNCASRKGTTAAIFAIWNQVSLALQLLVDAGADLDVRCVIKTYNVCSRVRYIEVQTVVLA